MQHAVSQIENNVGAYSIVHEEIRTSMLYADLCFTENAP